MSRQKMINATDVHYKEVVIGNVFSCQSILKSIAYSWRCVSSEQVFSDNVSFSGSIFVTRKLP